MHKQNVPDITLQNPKVELGKETRKEILAALKNIKTQLSAARHRESTAADVAADVLASGGGPLSAAKEALAFKADKAKANIKRRLDPLNIIHRMTGGSKLATTLAGKLMGRSEKSIRSAAGLQAREEAQVDAPEMIPEPTRATPVSDESLPGASAVDREKALDLFDRIAKAVALIALRVTDISVKMGATEPYKKDKAGRFHGAGGKFVSTSQVELQQQQANYLKELSETAFRSEKDEEKADELLSKLVKNSDTQADALEAMHDANAEAQYEKRFAKTTATQVTGSGKSKEEDTTGSWLSKLLATLMGAGMGLVGSIGSTFLKAGKFIGNLIMSAISGVGAKIVAFIQSGLSLLGRAGSAVKEGALGAFDATKKTAGKIVDFGKSVLGIPKTPDASTPPTTTPTPKTPSGSTSGATKIPKASIKDVVKSTGAKMMGKLAGGVAKSLPFVGAAVGGAMALKSLLDGDKTQAAIDAGAAAASLTGVGGVAALPVTMAATLANEAYKQMYGIDPLSDELKDSRLPEIASAAAEYVKEYLTPNASLAGTETPAMQPTAPAMAPKVSEVPPPAPTTGAGLLDSAELRATGGLQQQGPTVGPNITNMKTNNIHSTTIQQSMANPRSGESSYLRYVNQDFVPA
jgi:hypothetical protein